MINRRYVTFLGVLLAIFFGFHLRWGAITHTVVNNPIRADAQKYVLYAYNLEKHGVYTHSRNAIEGAPESLKPDALVTPGYPLFIGLFFSKDFQLNYFSLIFTQAILGSLSIGLVYLVFLPLGRISALGAALLSACSPHLISMSTYLLTETLFTFLIMAFLAGLIGLHQNKRFIIGFMLIGFLLGLATLTRPWIQAFILVLLIYFNVRPSKQSLLKSLLLLIGFLMVISPWIFRNYMTLGVPTDTSLSITSFQHGMYPDMMYNNQPESKGFAYRFDPWIKESQFTSKETIVNEFFRRVKDQPWVYLKWYTLGKVSTVFSWNMIDGVGDIFVYPVTKTPYETESIFRLTRIIMLSLHPILVSLAIVGTFLAWFSCIKNISENALSTLRLLSLFMLYFIIMHMIGAPYPRYSIPMRPIIYGMALTTLNLFFHYVRQLAVNSRF